MTTGKQLLHLFGSCALAASIALACGSATAVVKVEKTEYKKGDVTFKTMVAYDTATREGGPPS